MPYFTKILHKFYRNMVVSFTFANKMNTMYYVEKRSNKMNFAIIYFGSNTIREGYFVDRILKG